MDFNLSKEHQELCKAFESFCAADIAPNAARVDDDAQFPRDNWDKLAAQGFFALMLPEEYGGKDQKFTCGFAHLEALAAACGSTAMSASTSAWMCASTILKYGTGDLKKSLLPGLASGAKIGAFALAEPGAGSDINAITASAVKQGANWQLSGVKGLVWNGPVADIFIVFARTGDGNGGDRKPALSAFAVEKSAGIKADAPARTMGMRGAPASNIELNGCAAALLGDEGQGYSIAMDMLDIGRLQMAAIAIGLSRAAYIEAKAHAEDRVAFGKPIGVHQEVGFKIADIFVETDIPRLLAHKAAWQKQLGMKCDSLIACAKLLATEAAVRNANRAVQILGGRGYTNESAAERIYRDVKFTDIGQGTSEILRQLVAKELLGEGF